MQNRNGCLCGKNSQKCWRLIAFTLECLRRNAIDSLFYFHLNLPYLSCRHPEFTLSRRSFSEGGFQDPRRGFRHFDRAQCGLGGRNDNIVFCHPKYMSRTVPSIYFRIQLINHDSYTGSWNKPEALRTSSALSISLTHVFSMTTGQLANSLIR